MSEPDFYALMATAKDAVNQVAIAGHRSHEDATKSAHQLALAHEALTALGVPDVLPGDHGVLTAGAPATVAWRVKEFARVATSRECMDTIAAAWRATGEAGDAANCTLPDYVAKLVDKIEEQASELRYLKARDEDRKATNHATPFDGLLGQFAHALATARGQRLYFNERAALKAAWAEVVAPKLADQNNRIRVDDVRSIDGATDGNITAAGSDR